MSQLWKILLEGDEAGRFLFTKLSATESKCNVCQKTIQTPNRGITNLKQHLATHPIYLKKLQEIEKAEQAQKEAMQASMGKFVVRGTGIFYLFNYLI